MSAADTQYGEELGLQFFQASKLSKFSQMSRMGVGIVLGLIVLFLSVYKLESAPAFWWDEGWTLSVARNWVEHGHYGNLRNGEPVPPGLSGAWPIVAPIALSFQLFGVGLWQGRLVGVLFTLGALLLMYVLSRRLYNQAVGLTTLFVMSFMAIHPALHAVLTGRQVLGEMPVLFYLLLGYVCLFAGLQGAGKIALWGLAGAALAWGIALNTKLQAMPFWMVSLLGPLVLMAWQRRWAVVGRLGTGLLGTLLIAQGLVWVGHVYLNPGEVMSGLYDVTAFVPVAQVRLMAVQVVCVCLHFQPSSDCCMPPGACSSNTIVANLKRLSVLPCTSCVAAGSAGMCYWPIGFHVTSFQQSLSGVCLLRSWSTSCLASFAGRLCFATYVRIWLLGNSIGRLLEQSLPASLWESQRSKLCDCITAMLSALVLRLLKPMAQYDVSATANAPNCSDHTPAN